MLSPTLHQLGSGLLKGEGGKEETRTKVMKEQTSPDFPPLRSSNEVLTMPLTPRTAQPPRPRVPQHS